MLKGSVRLRPSLTCRPRSASRRLCRAIRAQSIQRPPSLEPRLRRHVFDNVDETTTLKDSHTTVSQEKGKPTVGNTREAWGEDWLAGGDQKIGDWGVTDQKADCEEGEETEEQFREEGNSYYKASSISVLNEADKERILPLIPIGEQADFYAPKEFSANLAWWGSALCGCVLFANSAAWMAALSLSVPIVLPWGLAGLRNWELQSSGKTAFMGVWHCQVLASEVLETQAPPRSGRFFYGGQRDDGATQKLVRLMIGDPWNGGARTEMVVPISERDEVPNIGELSDLLVLSNFSDFREFSAVREAFFPRTRVWLAEYPFMNRDNFYRLICAIQKQQTEVIMDRDHW